jgi:apolipoprotein N-acyltransferase
MRGYACGVTFFLVLLSWIPRVMVAYGGLPVALAWLVLALLVLYMATYVALFSFLLSAACRRLGPAALAAARSGPLGVAPGHLCRAFLARSPPVPQPAILQRPGRHDAVSALVVAANTGLALLVVPGASRKGRAAGWALLALVVSAQVAGRGLLRSDSDGAAAPIRVAAVQGNVHQDAKWDPGQEARIISDLVRLRARRRRGAARRLV